MAVSGGSPSFASLTVTGDASIDGVTVGQGGGNVATNTALGVSALAANTTGTRAVAVGYEALKLNTTCDRNHAFGLGALASNTTGDFNSALGYAALNANTSGSNNVAMGYTALVSNTTGNSNTAVGYQAGYGNTSGYNNTIVGQIAGYNLTTGYRNTLIGYAAGADSGSTQLTTGYQNIVIGWACDVSNANANNQIVLGADASGKGDSTGFINAGGGGVYQGNNSSSWSTTSDQRLKKNIVDNTDGLDKITSIRVRNFEYRLPEEVTELDSTCAVDRKGVQLGVIAQELREVCPDCVKEESTGVISVDSDNIFWHMVNAIKDLKAELDTVKAELAALKG
jgi:hypothetical protein